MFFANIASCLPAAFSTGVVAVAVAAFESLTALRPLPRTKHLQK